MTTLDLVILAALGIGAARGFATGALRQIASLVGLLAAFALALQFMHPAGRTVVQSLGLSPTVAPVVGFVVVFLAVQAVVFLITRIVEGLLQVFYLSFANRLAGGLVGALKAALLLSVLFLVLATFETPSDATREQSTLYEPVATALPTAWTYVTDQWPHLEAFYEEFEVPEEWIPESE